MSSMPLSVASFTILKGIFVACLDNSVDLRSLIGVRVEGPVEPGETGTS